jgi:putative ABC transport system permease protein
MLLWASLASAWQDLRHGARLAGRNPSFAITGVLTLALGIGANTAIFTVVNAVLLRPLPFPEPARLVRVWEEQPAKGYLRNVVNPENFLSWRERTRSFEEMAAVETLPANLTGVGDPVSLAGDRVSPQYFSILGATPAVGRFFVAEEGTPGRDTVAVLSYGLWQSRFGGDPAIAGKKIMLDGAPHTVIGVTSRTFHMPGRRADVWMPLPNRVAPEFSGGRFLLVVARLKRGVSLQQANRDLSAVAAGLAVERPDFDQGWTAAAVPMLEDATRDVRLPLLALLAAVGLVLLIACVNVANLLLMRSTGRVREMAVRAALGAGRGRLVRQLLAESCILALAGCAAGLAVAYAGVRGLVALIPPDSGVPRLDTIHMDGTVLCFVIGLSVVTVALFGLIPALQASQLEPQSALQQGTVRTAGRERGRLRYSLVVGEIALSLVLLAGAGLMLRSFAKLISVEPGFSTERILTMSLFTSPAAYGDTAKRAEYFRRMLEEIRATPGVETAGSTHFLPLQGRVSGSCFTRAEDGQPVGSTSPSAEFLVVSPGYFETMGTPLIQGRRFNAADSFGKPSVVLVNRAFARRYLSDRDPVGQQLNLCWPLPNPARIVGVVADARQLSLRDAPKPAVFVDNLQAPMYFAQLVVRVSGDPRRMSHAVQAAIHRVDPQQAVSGIETMEEVASDSMAQPRLQVTLLLVFGAMAALLAMAGVYGVLAYSVEQRRREIGIRVALGALPGDVSGRILRESLVLGMAGVAAGLAGALAVTRLLRSLLFEVKPNDPPTLLCAAAVLLVVVIAAALIPARRAARVDPMVALRYE